MKSWQEKSFNILGFIATRSQLNIDVNLKFNIRIFTNNRISA